MSAFEEGPKESQIAFLGEAPSYVEIRENRPFVGPAGHLFERCLHAAGIVRAASYVTNVFDTQIKKPRDDQSKIISEDGSTLLWSSGKGFSEAGKEASKNARERIRLCGANAIVALGGVATSLLMEENLPVRKWRGSILKSLSGRKIIPTIHPAACLRGVYEDRYLIVSDMKKAKRQSKFKEIIRPQRNLLIDPTFEQCVAFLKRCLESPIVNTDIELLGGQIDCFSLAVTPQEVISIPIVDAGFGNRFSVEEETEIWRLYAEIISSPRITKVNQNITFDLAILLQLNNIVPRGPVEDCMVAHSVMNPFLDKDLGTLCSLYTDESFYKDQGELHDSYTVADFSRRWEYNAKDSAVALECWNALNPLLDADGYRSSYEMTTRLIPSLLEMTVGGVKVNGSALAAAKAKAETDIAALVERMGPIFNKPIITEAPKTAAQKRAAAGALNINSPVQLAKFFYEERGFKPYLGSNGRPTTDDTALARIVRRDKSEEARLLQQYRKIDKQRSSYLSVRYDTDNRLRSSWNARGTWLGRLSSSKTVLGTGLNLQTVTDEFASFLEGDHELT